MSFVWGGIYVAGVVATLFIGGLLTVTSPYVVFGAAAPFAALIVFPTIRNWAGDEKLTAAQQAVQWERLMSQKPLVALAFIVMISTFVLTYSGMQLTTKQNAAVSLVVGVVVLSSFSLVLNPVIAKVNAFGMIQASLCLSLGGSSFYFMTDTPEEFPNGPHFSRTFYNIVLPVVGSLCSLVGIWLYNEYSIHFTYQKLYFVGNLIAFCLYGMDCVFYARLNLEMGINDHVFVLGASTLQSVVLNWMWLPSVVIMAQLCPRGMEAIMYANLAGCHNLGDAFSKNFGALLLEYMGVNPRGAKAEGAEFEQMWKISLICTVLPLCAVLLIPAFIPNKTTTDRLIPDDLLPTQGSLLQQWGFVSHQARDTSIIGSRSG
jgi:hypothetical protein